MTTDRLLEREDLLAELAGYLDDARTGVGSLVLVAGEAGAGKTSLIRAFSLTAGEKAMLMEGACDPLTTPRPLSPLLDFAADEGSGLDDLFAGEPDNIEIFSRVLERVRHTIRPVIMLVEDLHWADQATLDWLRFMGRRVKDVKAAVVCTYRDDEIGPDHPLQVVLGQLTPLGSTRRMVVPALSLHAVQTLAADSEVDPSELHRLTGGNAFFVTEVLAGGDALPGSVQDAVVARVAKLDENARRLVEAVSIAPRSLEIDRALELTGGAEDQIDAALAAGVIRSRDRMLDFRHELARSAIEESIPPGRRFSLHRLMLESLLADTSPDHARVAHHAIETDQSDLIARHAPTAAAEAAERGAHKEAVALYEAALRHRSALSPGEEIELRLLLAHEYGVVDRQDLALAEAVIAVDHFRESGDQSGLANALIAYSLALWRNTENQEAQAALNEARSLLEPLGPGDDMARVYYISAYHSMLARREGDARTYIERADELARSGSDQQMLWNIGMMRGTIEIVLGDPLAGAEVLERAVSQARRNGDRSGVAIALGMLGSGGGEARIYDRAIPALKDGVRWGLAHDQDYNLAYDRAWLARVAFEQGRWDEAVEYATIVDRTSQSRTGIAMVTGLGAHGRVLVRRGDPGGEELLRKVLEIGEGHEIQHIWSPICGLAEHYWLTGQPERMAPILEPAYQRAIDTDSAWARGEVGFWMWKAGLIDEMPKGAAEPFDLHASGRWNEAAQVWRAIGCPYEVALALAEGEGESLLEALTILDSLGARPAAALVRRRMRDLGIDGIPRGPSTATASNPAGLTNRQLDVLGLMAKGLSNSEIAESLYVSKKTVEHHVGAIYSKLGVRSRAKAIARAATLGLPGE